MPYLSPGPGAPPQESDATELLVLDATAVDLAVAADLAAAEVLAAAQVPAFEVGAFSRYVVTVELVAAGAATTLYLGARQSGKASPLVASVPDWSYYAIDNIDPLTGVSTTPPYQIDIPLPANPLRRYTRSFRVWGTWAGPIVWADGAGARGYVYAQRFVGG